METPIDIFQAIREMEQISAQGGTFQFAFIKWNRANQTGGQLVRISRAQLRKKTPDTVISHASHKLFFVDCDSGQERNCWQPLIKEFNGRKCKLN